VLYFPRLFIRITRTGASENADACPKKFEAVRRYELYTGHKAGRILLCGKLGYREFERKPQSANVMLICMEKKKT
jgi:hypothetical protein